MMNNTAFGRSGSKSVTIFVHLEHGHVVQEHTHATFQTCWTVAIRDEGNAWRGPRIFVREFATKRAAWEHLKSVTKNACNGVRIAA